MAPEVYKGEVYGSNVDIYSLGIVMYKLLNNNLEPFRTNRTYSDGETALEKRMKGESLLTPVNADGRLAEIVLKACSYNPKERYESPIQMRDELEAILYGDNESKLIYPEGDKLNYENSAENIANESAHTVSMFSHEGTSDIDLPRGNETDNISGLSEDKYQSKTPITVHIYDENDDTDKTAGFSHVQPINVQNNVEHNSHREYDATIQEQKVDIDYIKNIYVEFLKKIFVYKGCTDRKEFWILTVINLLSLLLLDIISTTPVLPLMIAAYVACIALLLAWVALFTRRLHDTGHSGHWQWLSLTVYGAIVVLVFCCFKSKNENNKYRI